MSLQNDIEEAIHMHGAWKARFRDFLSGRVALDPAQASSAEGCALGRWLQSEGERLLAPADLEAIRDHHARFHQVVGQILRQIKEKDFQSARQALAPGGLFEETSRELVVALRKAGQRGRAASSAGSPPGAAPPPAGEDHAAGEAGAA